MKKSKRWIRQIKSKIKDLMEKWQYAEEADEYDQWNKYDCDVYVEDFKQQEFGNTLGIMQNIEFAEASTLGHLFDHQMKNLQHENSIAYEVNKEYRSGIMDPVRDVAQHERQAAIKKRIIRKKEFNS